MIVPDASVISDFLVDAGSRGQQARRVLSADPVWVVPEPARAEVFSFLRRVAAGGRLPEAVAHRAVQRLGQFHLEVVTLPEIMERMWSMRHAISAYHAGYVAIAAERGLTLVTADARLARTALQHCRVELVT